MDESKAYTAPLHEQVRRLEQSNLDLIKENARLKSFPGKLALYIYLDGALQTKPPMSEPSETGARAIRRYQQDHIASDRGYPLHYRTEWRLVFETQAYYVYEQIA